MMDGFTLAQITDFIAAAQEANAHNVLAALLEYKNNNFADFDPWTRIHAGVVRKEYNYAKRKNYNQKR